MRTQQRQEERGKKPRWKNRIANNGRKDLNNVASVKQKPDLLQQKKRLIKMTAAAESWRFIAFFCFWAMCLFAITITRLIVVDKLAAGPKFDPCDEPLNQENPGLGFDFDSANHLLQQFGFSPILVCANWDYSPVRELTAMVYPLFEYSLLIYLALDFYTIKLSYQRGESSKWFWTLTKIFFPIEIILTAWFRKLVFYHHFTFSSMQENFLHSHSIVPFLLLRYDLYR